LGNGWYLLKEEKQPVESDHLSSRKSPPSQENKQDIVNRKHRQ
jgi:hypothetical protein